MNIPDDLRALLAKPRRRSFTVDGCGLGRVILRAPDELVVKMFTIYKKDGFNKDKFRGVDLVKSCENGDPAGIMVWFPALKLYGTWDCDHHKIIVFPGATWTDIAEDPEPYFNAQWEEPYVTHRYLRPRPRKPSTGRKKP